MKHYDAEEAFHKDEKREIRKDRKILTQKDRSKYKKTDRDKRKIALPKEDNLQKGRVLAIMAEGILVDSEENILYMCTLRGTLKKEKARIKNIVAVGDFVQFVPAPDKTGTIAFVEERHSILSRAEQMTRHKEQIIAVNIDQVLITCSVVIPLLKPPLIDRYIIAALKGNMQPVIVINKIDLLSQSKEEALLFDEVVKIYTSLGFPVYPISTKTGEGMEKLKKGMQGKSSVLSGQSGAGKSSIINAVIGSDLLTGEVIAKTKKGSHTTTSTTLLPLEGKGFCIDTPGISSFGMWELKKEEVQQFFSEIAKAAEGCKYPDCSHIKEPGCAVRKEVEKGVISPLRFDSYCALIASLNQQHYTR